VHARSLAVVVSLALGLIGCGETDRQINRAAPSAQTERSSTLYLAGNEEMWVVDVDAERAQHLRMRLAAGDPPHLIAAIGDRLALWSYDVTSVPAADPTARPTMLAEDGWIFIRGAAKDRIWVGFLDPDSPETERELGELREIAADGDVITRGVEPPDGAWPYAELTSGLLFDVRETLTVWDPEDQRTVRTFPRELIGDMGPVSGDLLASCRASCEELILTDFAAGTQRHIAAPEGLTLVAPLASFSPDGTLLAIPVKQAGGSWTSLSYDRQLALLSLKTGDVRIVPGSTVPPGYVITAWSAEGDEVFITGGERFKPRTIIAYRLDDHAARKLDIEVGDFYDMVAR
jgi:hypothetical protein